MRTADQTPPGVDPTTAFSRVDLALEEVVKAIVPIAHRATMNTVTSPTDPMRLYRAKRDLKRPAVRSKYTILGFISSGTYGRVYKAQAINTRDNSPGAIYAIKKFKPDKEGEVITYTGISQSACREIAVSM